MFFSLEHNRDWILKFTLHLPFKATRLTLIELFADIANRRENVRAIEYKSAEPLRRMTQVLATFDYSSTQIAKQYFSKQHLSLRARNEKSVSFQSFDLLKI